MNIKKVKQPPPYHLRHNKAVDRFLLVELLKQLDRVEHEFTQNACYCGFGGPYLEDIRLIHENFPEMQLYSFELCKEVHKRQGFHVPCKNVELFLGDYNSILVNNRDIFDNNVVIWLDYVDFEPNVITDFTHTISALQSTSVIRVTVKADYEKYTKEKFKSDPGYNPFDIFREKFGYFIPSSMNREPVDDNDFVQLVRVILLMASQQASPASSGRAFVPVMSTLYSDSTVMYSLTGIMYVTENAHALNEKQEKVNTLLSQWNFANELNGKVMIPEKIDLPYLTIKERLHLQKFLPCEAADDPGEILFSALSYSLCDSSNNDKPTQDKSDEQTKELLRNYAKFYRFYPYFLRGNP